MSSNAHSSQNSALPRGLPPWLEPSARNHPHAENPYFMGGYLACYYELRRRGLIREPFVNDHSNGYSVGAPADTVHDTNMSPDAFGLASSQASGAGGFGLGLGVAAGGFGNGGLPPASSVRSPAPHTDRPPAAFGPAARPINPSAGFLDQPAGFTSPDAAPDSSPAGFTDDNTGNFGSWSDFVDWDAADSPALPDGPADESTDYLSPSSNVMGPAANSPALPADPTHDNTGYLNLSPDLMDAADDSSAFPAGPTNDNTGYLNLSPDLMNPAAGASAFPAGPTDAAASPLNPSAGPTNPAAGPNAAVALDTLKGTQAPPKVNAKDKWVCPHCGKEVVSEGWKKHLANHVRQCGHSDCASLPAHPDAAAVTGHILQAHGGGAEWTTSSACPWCGKAFKSKAEYSRHVRVECITPHAPPAPAQQT